MSSDRDRIGEILRRAAAEFERNGLSRGVIRQCEREAPEAFVQQGLKVLLEAGDSAGYRFLAVLLVQSPSVFQRLTDRWQFTRDEAVKVATGLQRVDRTFDTRLSALLSESVLDSESVCRALEILDEISPGRRIVSIMRHLTSHQDSKISAKAALLIGKRLQNLAWARRVMAESTDARLRANAIETMWGLSGPEVVDLYRECLRDWDNRVVGNAIIGLHRAGASETGDHLAAIAGDANPKLRMTAAWAIGHIGDCGLVSVLSPLAKDPHPEVRRAALRSLRTFHQEEIRAKESLPVEAVDVVQVPVPVPEPVPAATHTGPNRQFWG